MTLPWNAKACPKDRAPLHWEQFAGFIVARVENGRRVYRCRCPQCHQTYEIRRRLPHD